jgi:hypothetical protein
MIHLYVDYLIYLKILEDKWYIPLIEGRYNANKRDDMKYN